MEITGKLALILDAKRGESARGAWLRSGFVLDVTEGQYTRKIAFSIWGEDKYNALKAVSIGTTIKVIFNIESREYQERWFTDCRCSQIETFNTYISNDNKEEQKQEEPNQEEKEEEKQEEDLPF
jgi:hypothetical protein